MPDGNEAAHTEHQEQDRRAARAFLDPRFEGRRLLAEVWGTFLLVLVAAGGRIVWAQGGIGEGAKAVAPGLMVMVLIYTIGVVSGAHLNPAVTFAFALRGNFPWRRVPGYWAAQLCGATLAGLLLLGLFGHGVASGGARPEPGLPVWAVVGLEAVLTMGLVNAVLATAAGGRNVGANGALAVGGYVALAGLWAEPVSGASMNPARSLGPDLIAGTLAQTWVYVVGPLVGAALGVGMQWLLRGPPTPEGSRSAQGLLGDRRHG